MANQHPITPPPELIQQWWKNAEEEHSDNWDVHAAVSAARWGADQELEACCEWIDTPAEFETVAWNGRESDQLRAARRPKPPSLKEQALEALDRMDQLPTAEDQHIIRRALEQLDD